MKIASIINYSLKNRSIPLKNASTPTFAYNLPCDTVSFSGKKQDNKCIVNSAEIFANINNGSYEECIDFIKNLDAKSWNPNFCVDLADDGTTCILELVLNKLQNYETNSKAWNDLHEISSLITAHPEFKNINPGNGVDLMSFVIDDYQTDIALQIMKSKNFEKSDAYINQYLMLAEGMENQTLINELQKIKPQNPASAPIVGVFDAVIVSPLTQFQVFPNENDPKSLNEVGGMFEAKEAINEFVIRPWNKDFREKIIENKLNRPSGILLSGPPGCGKTYIMKAIAAETGYNLYEVNLANIGASEGYKTQSELKKVFDSLEEQYEATGEPSILVLDELDSIAMKRQNCQTDWKKDDINALLMVMNNSAQRGIIVVGATNNPDDLDDAVKRSGRLDKHIKIDLPGQDECKDIVEKILQDRPIGAQLLENSQEIAEKLKGMSPADISSILHKACLNAIYEYKDTADMDDFEKILKSLKRDSNDKGRIVIKGYAP